MHVKNRDGRTESRILEVGLNLHIFSCCHFATGLNLVTVPLVTTFAMLLSSILLLVSLNLVGLGCCGHVSVTSGWDFKTGRPIPQLVRIGGVVPTPRYIELRDIISPIVRKMLLRGAMTIPFRGERIQQIVKRGRETEGSWAPSSSSGSWHSSGRDLQLDINKPFFARDRVGMSKNRAGLFERILKRTGQYERKWKNQNHLYPWRFFNIWAYREYQRIL